MSLKNQHEDELFRKLLGSSRMKMPFSGLEDEIMAEIEQFDDQKETIRLSYKRGLQFAGVFFMIGLICGLILTTLIPKLEFSIAGLDNSFLLVFYQTVFAITVLLFIEKLYLHWKRLKEL